MKHYYSVLFFLAMIAFGMKATAQCSSCTSTVTGTDASPHLITSGTTLCVSPTGTLSGPVTIQTGGTLCNQGTVSSYRIWVDGGNFQNYGTVNSNNILVSNAGGFNNFGTADIDSLLVTGVSSNFLNSAATLTDMRLAFTDNASGVNSGTITCDYFGDSLATFSNDKNMTINYDFYNTYNSNFSTSNSASYLKINRNFYNSTGCTVNVGPCMIAVGQDWYNSGTINGPGSMGGHCGGFSIAGVSLNAGTVGTSGQHVDLCDAGHPSTGIDGNSGTIASTTTYCTCASICAPLGVSEVQEQSNVLIAKIYPNPAVNELAVMLNAQTAETVTVEVFDMMGKKQTWSSAKTTVGENKMTLDVSRLSAGTYILSITDARGGSAKRIFVK